MEPAFLVIGFPAIAILWLLYQQLLRRHNTR
jgi:hypothetical protein